MHLGVWGPYLFTSGLYVSFSLGNGDIGKKNQGRFVSKIAVPF